MTVEDVQKAREPNSGEGTLDSSTAHDVRLALQILHEIGEAEKSIVLLKIELQGMVEYYARQLAVHERREKLSGRRQAGTLSA